MKLFFCAAKSVQSPGPLQNFIIFRRLLFFPWPLPVCYTNRCTARMLPLSKSLWILWNVDDICLTFLSWWDKRPFSNLFYPRLMPFPASRVAAKPKPVSVLLKQRCYQTIKCATKTDGPTKSRAQSWFGHETSPFFNPQLYTQRRRGRNSWPDSSFWWHFRWISLHQMENVDVLLF